MKNKIKNFTAVALIILSLILCACQNAENDIAPTYDENGKYIGFSDIPDGYTAEEAIADGCLVIDTVKTGVNEYGVTLYETPTTEGYDEWLEFIDRSDDGKDAFLRVAHYIEGVGYYRDLYYKDGKYTIFDCNEYGVSEGETFTYLRSLDGYVGPVGSQKEDCYYVLTDSLELTYEDVSWSYLSSDHNSVTKIPFVWLSFMIYFE